MRAITFIEVLVVMIILSLIAGIIGTQLLSVPAKAKVDVTKIQISSIEGALDRYFLENSTFPTSEQGLEALIRLPEVGVIPKNWQGPYLKANSAPTDGWKNPFIYRSDGRDYTIISLGADGVEGGTELDADISSKNL
ncbi:MAG: type II secretion system major pseudopilin GspG [Candidatus Lambdaproteobacteria bacterium]|nr:type II secretion system major pseudopilin GspG [Candidatus Lambdaproteobacteria bacterium]